ncbi:MAG TPA: DNA polymerase I [Geminocystis sp. M7585_C2015_104]|nr:DNA polymerase I [Geminocystis sp. M7585_C2015_104]
MSDSDKPLLLIVDGHSLAYRAYYALAKGKKKPLYTSDGIPTSVCFGFLNSLFTIINTYSPHYLAVAFDVKSPTFRHTTYNDYKANRQETPSDFLEDITNLQQVLRALNIPVITAEGYEADDVIGTIATKGAHSNLRVYILTGDRDLWQLVNDKAEISVLYADKTWGKYELYHEKEVLTRLGIKPNQIVDYRALCGDKSDNIPGVLGIGEKTACQLICEYETLDGIYNNLDKIKPAIRNRLIQGREDAYHSQSLARIVTSVDLSFSWDEFRLKGFAQEKVIPLFQRLELHSFLKRIDEIQQKLGGVVANKNTEEKSENSSKQMSLFEWGESNSPSATIVVDELPKLARIIDNIKEAKLTAWDTETDSLETQYANLVGIGVCWGKSLENTAYIPLGHTSRKQLDWELVKQQLKPILEDEKYPKTFHNTKFDRLVLLHHGVTLRGVVFDTMLASYVLQPEESHKLSNLCVRYRLDFIARDYGDLKIDKNQTIAHLSPETVAQYCGLDVLATFHLTEKLREELAKIPSLQTVFNLELKLESVLAKMEANGVLIDTDYFQKLSEEMEGELKEIETKIFAIVGKFNLASPRQLSELLFEKLGLDKSKSLKTKTGYSTNQDVLERLIGAHPVVELILQHRTLSKLKSTYVDALPTLVNPKTRRIHTNYNQTVTATGRLSSSNPNLQNIPIRTAFSRRIRRGFIPEEGCLFLSADYSQIELRILAHLSEEERLIDAYKNNLDIHTVTARILLGKEDITPEERNIGKTINFGIIYGMGAQKFARETGVDVATAKKFIDIYHQKYPKVFEYLERVKKEAIINGYVTTILGRRRYFHFSNDVIKGLKNRDINSFDLTAIKLDNQTAQMLRAAANAPIQGSSADIIKLAMIAVDEILNREGGKLLLQVHDELVFEIPSERIDCLTPKIRAAMESVISLKIPLVVDTHVGSNWMDAK